MEPVTIAIICAAVFGVVGILAAFIRQLLISRDKNLNDQAQQRALAKEAKQLDRIRKEMASEERFDSHYKVLGSNKEAIQYIDQKIDDILKKKEEIIHRYAHITLKESSAIVAGEGQVRNKETCDLLKLEIDKELELYENELQQLQDRRSSLWDAHGDLQDNLIKQEKQRNEHLDSIYMYHSNMLEKIYIRHQENSETIAIKSMDASTQTFKSALMLPFALLTNLFKSSSNVDSGQAKQEKKSREQVSNVQDDIGDSEEVRDEEAKTPQSDSDRQGKSLGKNAADFTV